MLRYVTTVAMTCMYNNVVICIQDAQIVLCYSLKVDKCLLFPYIFFQHILGVARLRYYYDVVLLLRVKGYMVDRV